MTGPIAASLHPRRDALEAKLAAARAASDAEGRPGGPAWNAYFAAQKLWKERPWGRDAEPGDLMGWWLPGEVPYGGEYKCRRCRAWSSPEGHPYGCSRTPRGIDGGLGLDPLRPCYCGGALVVAPETFGSCCDGTPPVRVPGGCRWCGSDLCAVNDPDDLPEHDYYVKAQFPRMGDAWVHPRCIDASLLAKDPAPGELAENTPVPSVDDLLAVPEKTDLAPRLRYRDDG